MVLFLFTTVESTWALGFGFRGGIGQFASQTEELDGRTGNSFLLGAYVNPISSFRIDLGVRHNRVNKTSISDIPTQTSSYSVTRISRKIYSTSVYLAPGLNIDLSQIGTGLGAYGYFGGGMAFPTVVNDVEYSDGESDCLPEIKDNREEWKVFWLVGSGLKIQIFYIGIFGEFTYYNGTTIQYEPVSVGDVELMPGGDIETKGFAIYAGLCWH